MFLFFVWLITLGILFMNGVMGGIVNKIGFLFLLGGGIVLGGINILTQLDPDLHQDITAGYMLWRITIGWLVIGVITLLFHVATADQ